MIKFNGQLERKVRIDSWLLKLLSRDIKTETKNKDQPTTIIKNYRKIKNNRKIKPIGNIAPTMDHYPRNG